ncbi:MAG: hypothetical protein PHE06_06520 [Lachnospiraceae bacterium]|nr:hypothetical protein [Lachnospiraceae bacterium]MDD3795608.1 hypothetical protein [Lachnospiraceae bacterium]
MTNLIQTQKQSVQTRQPAQDQQIEQLQQIQQTPQVREIYDRIFKRIFSLSNLAIINLINGLFGTNYPPDSIVDYPNREYVSKLLSKRLADVMVVIQGIPYHLEAQMKWDGSIIMRVFEYGFHQAMSLWQEESVFQFPEPVVIYLDSVSEIPEKSILTIQFGFQGTFQYEVKNFVYQEHELLELNQKKMIVLIPFQLLKLKKIVEKPPAEENLEALQKLVQRDIIGSIKANLQVGNITSDDANQLLELTSQLYEHIYQHYEELGGYDDMKPLLDGALELPLDKYRIQIDKLEEEKAKAEKKNAEMEEECRKLREKIKELEVNKQMR